MHLSVPLCEWWISARSSWTQLAFPWRFLTVLVAVGRPRFHRLWMVFEVAYCLCLVIFPRDMSSLGVVIRGRLDLGFSLTCSGFFMCLVNINDASNCSSMYTHGITGHRLNTFQSCVLLFLGNGRAARHRDHKLVKLCQTSVWFLKTLGAFTAQCSVKICWIFTRIETYMGQYALKISCDCCDAWNKIRTIVVSLKICGHNSFRSVYLQYVRLWYGAPL